MVIEDPDVFLKLGDADIVIPSALVRGIDYLKKNPDPDAPRARAARNVARILDRLGNSHDITKGAITSSGTTVKAYHV